jgi:hypothetical protein
VEVEGADGRKLRTGGEGRTEVALDNGGETGSTSALFLSRVSILPRYKQQGKFEGERGRERRTLIWNAWLRLATSARGLRSSMEEDMVLRGWK